jgi:hypothetical protein
MTLVFSIRANALNCNNERVLPYNKGVQEELKELALE